MNGSERSESSLEAAAGTAGPHATEAFALLGNETRLAILLALWEAHDPSADDDAVSFSELYDRVEYETTANFSYHLEKLEGRFVRKTDTGYRLRMSGFHVVQSVIAGTGIEEPTLEPTEIDVPCPACDGSTAVTYEHGRVYLVCTECDGLGPKLDREPPGALYAWTFEPTGLTNRSPEEIFAASTVKTFGRIALRFEGICPECSGSVEWSLDACDDHEPGPDGECPRCGRDQAIVVREVCTVCKSWGAGSPSVKILSHPAVVAFFYDRGVELGFPGDTDFENVVERLAILRAFEQDVVSTDPLRVLVTVRFEGDELRLTLDEEMNVVEVTE